MTNTKEKASPPMSECSMCGYAWPTETDGDHRCAPILRDKLDRAITAYAELRQDLIDGMEAVKALAHPKATHIHAVCDDAIAMVTGKEAR